MKWAYYNDNDPGAAQWLRHLILCGHIVPGYVDERSILDVKSEDLNEFGQCHFFAGIGGWSYALRLAGIPDDFPVWTGSPPCQPFSVAGQDKRDKDERHLAPHFINLVRSARPGVLLGEQVASAAVFGKAAKPSRSGTETAPEWAWIDDLSDRLEAAQYAVGASDIPSAGIGAPHIRQRTFFGAYDLGLTASGVEHDTGNGRVEGRTEPSERSVIGGCERYRVADTAGGNTSTKRQQSSGEHGLQSSMRGIDGVVNSIGSRLEGQPWNGDRSGESRRVETNKNGSVAETGDINHPCPTNGFWRDADWLYCRDGKWRSVMCAPLRVVDGVSRRMVRNRSKRAYFPLTKGQKARVGLLRGFGNAINPWAAKPFIEAFMESVDALREE